jgi:hypothetical protein
MNANRTSMETLMRVIEANQDNMKEREYLEAMNALRDLHRNQEHDYEAIMRPLREEIQKDMQNLWKWVFVPPFDADGDKWFTSAKETVESWLHEDTIENLHEWKEHYELHNGEFEWCEDCSTCLTCTACQCCGSESEEAEPESPHSIRERLLREVGHLGDLYEQCEKCEEWFQCYDPTTHEFSTHDGDGNVVRKEGRTCSNCNRACVGCGSSEVVYWECGGELGCNMCEKCFT